MYINVKNHYRLSIEQIKDNILDWISKSNNPKPLENLLTQLKELGINLKVFRIILRQ